MKSNYFLIEVETLHEEFSDDHLFLVKASTKKQAENKIFNKRKNYEIAQLGEIIKVERLKLTAFLE